MVSDLRTEFPALTGTSKRCANNLIKHPQQERVLCGFQEDGGLIRARPTRRRAVLETNDARNELIPAVLQTRTLGVDQEVFLLACQTSVQSGLLGAGPPATNRPISRFGPNFGPTRDVENGFKGNFKAADGGYLWPVFR